MLLTIGIWVVAVIFLLALLAFIAILFLLIREDGRAQAAIDASARNAGAADIEERRQKVVAGTAVWQERVFHTGIDRETNTRITRSSVLDTPEAKALWAKMEEEFTNPAKGY